MPCYFRSCLYLDHLSVIMRTLPTDNAHTINMDYVQKPFTAFIFIGPHLVFCSVILIFILFIQFCFDKTNIIDNTECL